MIETKGQITARLYEAQQYTFELFGRDSRKASLVPYMAHLLSVCALVLQDGGDEDEAVAGLLHDVLEDKPELVKRADIRDRYGEKVLQIIEVTTDTPVGYMGGEKPAWKQRKQAYVDRIRNEDPMLLRVSLADKVDNARSILADHARLGEEIWERFHAGREEQLWYYEAALAAFKDSGCNGFLFNEFTGLVGVLKQLKRR